MSDSKQPPATEKGTVAEGLSYLFAKGLSDVTRDMNEGILPGSEDIDKLERLTKIKAFLATQGAGRRKRYELIALCLAILLFGALNLVRLRTTAADIEISATRVHISLDAQDATSLIPGETGQILALRHARVSGAEKILPPNVGENGSFEIKQLAASDSLALKRDPEDLAVRLQEIALPGGSSESIVAGVAYVADARGLTIETSGSTPVEAVFGRVIPIQTTPNGGKSLGYAISPVRVAGNNLSFELLPTKGTSELTVFRDIRVSQITFEDSGRSTILGGAAFIKGNSSAPIQLQPSDRFTIQSDTPMLLRELTLTKGELKARLSAPRAKDILLGDDSPRNLMPTWFQWIRYRWPSELYATISALIVAWLAIRRWMESSE